MGKTCNNSQSRPKNRQGYSIRKHLSRYSIAVNRLLPKNKKKIQEYFTDFVGIDVSKYEEMKAKFTPNRYLWKHVNADKLVVPVQGFKPDFKAYKIQEDANLRCLEAIKNRNPKTTQRWKRLIHYTGQINCCEVPEVPEDKGKDRMVEHVDYLLNVRVYVPKMHGTFTFPRKPQILQVSQEFLVYANHTLDHLRDRIACRLDYEPVLGDVSENPFVPTTVTQRNVFRSSMFYINNTFFVDGRLPENLDYSVVIKEWGVSKKINLGETKFMEDTTFSSLKIRLGYPYLFKHEGECEHLVIFTDARLASPSDLLVKNAYPLLKSYAGLRGKQCGLCSQRLAKFFVKGMKTTPVCKMHMCGICLYHYCYVGDKKIRPEFSVFKYVDRVALF